MTGRSYPKTHAQCMHCERPTDGVRCGPCGDAYALGSRDQARQASEVSPTAREKKWQLKYGQQRARCAVFMQVMAGLARRGGKDAVMAKVCVSAADRAAQGISIEDFVVAKINEESDQ